MSTYKSNTRKSKSSKGVRDACNRFHNKSSASDTMNDLNLPSLEEIRILKRLIMFYKIFHQTVVVPSAVPMSSGSRIRNNYTKY